MRQLAWLGFYRGKWHLLTTNPQDPVRQWMDKESALSDPAGEGLGYQWAVSEDA